MHERAIVWSVAGSDRGGGAGIQADLRAFDAFGVHGCTAVAAITAQNSVAVQRVEAVTPDLLDAQLAALAEDLPPLAIKSGLLGSADNVRVLATAIACGAIRPASYPSRAPSIASRNARAIATGSAACATAELSSTAS